MIAKQYKTLNVKCVKTSTYVHKLRKFEQIYIPLFPYYYSNDCSNIPFFKYYSIREKNVKGVFFLLKA